MNVVGGVRVDEPGCDLAVALAVASAARGRPPVERRQGAPLACFGELGLTGELRWVGHPERRLDEAAKHGLDGVIAPARERSPGARRRRCARRWRWRSRAGAAEGRSQRRVGCANAAAETPVEPAIGAV